MASSAAALGMRPAAVKVNGTSYTPDGNVGEGAYSTVIRAYAIDGTKVAIKRCRLATKDAAVAFRRECTLMQRAAHRNVVRVIDFEIAKDADGGVRGDVVLELCELSVVERMQMLEASGKRFSPRQIASILGAVGHAILHMHSLDPPITHRDIKPENILITADGGIKLTDFGSATEFAIECTTAQHVALADAIINKHTTMAYRAPEMADLWQKKRVDERSDVWAFGVLAYYLCFFKLPFEETKLAIINTPLEFPTGEASGLPTALNTVMRGCMTKEADRRMAMVDAMAALHEAFPEQVAALPAQHSTANRVPQLVAEELRAVVAPRAAQADSGPAPPPKPAAKGGGALFGMLDWSAGGGGGGGGGGCTSASPSASNSTVPGAASPFAVHQAPAGTSSAPLTQQHQRTVSSTSVDLFTSPSFGAGPGEGPSVRAAAQSSPPPAAPAAELARPPGYVDLFGTWQSGPAASTSPPPPPSHGNGSASAPDLFGCDSGPQRQSTAPAGAFDSLFVSNPSAHRSDAVASTPSAGSPASVDASGGPVRQPAIHHRGPSMEDIFGA